IVPRARQRLRLGFLLCFRSGPRIGSPGLLLWRKRLASTSLATRHLGALGGGPLLTVTRTVPLGVLIRILPIRLGVGLFLIGILPISFGFLPHPRDSVVAEANFFSDRIIAASRFALEDVFCDFLFLPQCQGNSVAAVPSRVPAEPAEAPSHFS